MNQTLRSGRRNDQNPIMRILSPAGPASVLDWSSFVNAMLGAAAFAGVLMFIAGSVDAPMARIANGVDPSIARLLLAFSQIGAANWMLAASGLVGIAALVKASLSTRPRSRAGFAVLAMRAGFFFLVVALSVVLVQAVKYGLGRTQPYLMNEFGAFHFSVLSADAFAASFPSGHATTGFAAATVMALFVPRWQGVFFLLAIAVAVARVAIGVHFPSDVLGGMVLGVALAFMLARYFARRRLVFRLADGKLVRRGERMVRRALRAEVR